MPRSGWSKKRDREYEELKEEFKEEGRYKGREEEVAARVVNKQRAQYGETKEAQQEEREGKSEDEGLPIKDYDTLTIDEIVPKLEKLSDEEIKQIRAYERTHKDRETLLEEIDRIRKR